MNKIEIVQEIVAHQLTLLGFDRESFSWQSSKEQMHIYNTLRFEVKAGLAKQLEFRDPALREECLGCMDKALSKALFGGEGS